jgi:hypothetical protein
VDVQAGLPLGVHINRLEESKLGVLEAWIDADPRLVEPRTDLITVVG